MLTYNKYHKCHKTSRFLSLVSNSFTTVNTKPVFKPNDIHINKGNNQNNKNQFLFKQQF